MEYIVPNRKRLPYGMMNFAVIRREDYYYVDKNGVMATSGWVYWDYNYYYPRSWGGMQTGSSSSSVPAASARVSR